MHVADDQRTACSGGTTPIFRLALASAICLCFFVLSFGGGFLTMVKIRPPNWKIPGPNCLLQLDLRCQSTQQKTMEPEVSSRSTCWHFLDDAVQAAKPLWQKLPSRLQPAAACLSRTIQYLLYVHTSRAGVVMSTL